jgi:hypothetical protein
MTEARTPAARQRRPLQAGGAALAALAFSAWILPALARAEPAPARDLAGSTMRIAPEAEAGPRLPADRRRG